ncbi:hypothetical protein GCM10008967_36370 [Bacillus carboniphilus]|uniref:Integral membrane protein n=1 Tax=Bacillus carboniphilus TaxID=86663 RepID=A0ABN0WNE5_9BACI
MILMVATITIFWLIIWKIPKQVTKLEMYVTSFFSLYLALLADSILGGMYKLYSYFKPGVHYMDLVAGIGIYPAVNILFLNLFPYKSSLLKKYIYIFVWTIFSLLYEWFAANHSDLFNYQGWRTWYSAPIYPLLFIILLLNLKWVRLLIKRGITCSDF